MESQRYCKQCLYQEISSDNYFKNMHEYIENIDPDIKTSSVEYERRLSLCKQCDMLINGMCRICGCFVEMRAAVRKNYCPSEKKTW